MCGAFRVISYLRTYMQVSDGTVIDMGTTVLRNMICEMSEILRKVQCELM